MAAHRPSPDPASAVADRRRSPTLVPTRVAGPLRGARPAGDPSSTGAAAWRVARGWRLRGLPLARSRPAPGPPRASRPGVPASRRAAVRYRSATVVAGAPTRTPVPSTRRSRAIARVPNSHAIVRRLLDGGRVSSLIAGDPDSGGSPTYYSRLGDPVYRLHCSSRGGGARSRACESRSRAARCPPAGSQPRGNDHDAHMTVIDQASGWEYDLWHVTKKPPDGGTLVFGWGGRTRIDGDGLRLGRRGRRLRQPGGADPRPGARQRPDRPRADDRGPVREGKVRLPGDRSPRCLRGERGSPPATPPISERAFSFGSARASFGACPPGSGRSPRR